MGVCEEVGLAWLADMTLLGLQLPNPNSSDCSATQKVST